MLKLILITATAAWMAFIFSMSARSAESSSAMSIRLAEGIFDILIPDFGELGEDKRSEYIEAAQFPVRKGAHFMEFAVLGALLFWDVSLFTGAGGRRAFLLAVLLALAYAASDEFHQLFEAERSGKLTDILIDAMGACAGAFFCRMLRDRRR